MAGEGLPLGGFAGDGLGPSVDQAVADFGVFGSRGHQPPREGARDPVFRLLPGGVALGPGESDGVDRHGRDVVARGKVVGADLVDVQDSG